MKYLILIMFLFLFSCKEKDETIDLKYEVLNQLITEDIMMRDKSDENNYVYNIQIKNVSFPENKQIGNNFEELPPGLSMMINYDKDFLETDSLFYKTQAEGLQDFKFEKSRIIQKVKYITSKELESFYLKTGQDFWKEFSHKYPNTCIKTFSVPFFNKEKNTCIVTVSASCGPLWGGGFMGIYKKVNGKWILIGRRDSWIS